MLKLSVLVISFVLLSPTAIVGILPYIMNTLGITQFEAENLVTIPSFATMIFVLFSDLFIKRIGIKYTVITGLLISGISGIAPLILPISYLYLLITRFLFGAGIGLLFTPSVNLLSILFDKNERVKLIGFRSATEMLGQSILTLLMGVLVYIGWRMAFLTNLVFFIIAICVFLFIPNIKKDSIDNTMKSKKVPTIIFPISLFICLIAISSSMIAIRFPSIASDIVGYSFNASIWAALKPIIGIIAAIYFGKIYNKIGESTLFIGSLILIISQVLIGYSGDNLVILIIGYLLSSFVLGWIVPVIINYITSITQGKQQRISTGFVLLSAHIGILIMPLLVRLIETSLQFSDLRNVFIFMATVVFVVISIIFLILKLKLRKGRI